MITTSFSLLKKQKYTFKELLKETNSKNFDKEYDREEPVGEEVWWQKFF
ncbi:hypothetical protein [Myxosarcina sp. GI1]|nr:hypothetical protein [Myxosarcina sp. GI1]